MAYKKDQGRYMRMGAFWSLFLLAGYGCLGGLTHSLYRWLPSIAGDNAAEPWIQHFPMLGQFGLAELIAILILTTAGIWIHQILMRPKVADLLIDTETELKKVTWPSMSETMNGTIAVAMTVVALFVFLSAADTVIAFVMDTVLKQRSS
jgi:preprotein translocase SecE subunit